MDRCDVLIVGGGPAGSSCARELVHTGYDVVVADKAEFPRDKVCAGWVTPPVMDALQIDLDDYARGRTLQPLNGFVVGRMGDVAHRHVYERPISYGIRRCEFDHYLLQRSGARVITRRVDAVSRDDGWWTVAGLQARILVGAGGHFCPVARALSPAPDAAVIAAQEAEYELPDGDAAACAIDASVPELYFTRDLTGYGWAFRKGAHLNVGLGVRAGYGARPLSSRVSDFVDFLVGTGRLGAPPRSPMRGHAYVLRPDGKRRVFGDGFVIIGDAAALAYDRSGEGIRPAMESGFLAADVIAIALASGRTDAAVLAPYDEALRRRFGAAGRSRVQPQHLLPRRMEQALAAALIGQAWFSRRMLLERWFLHMHDPALPRAKRRVQSARVGESPADYRDVA